MMFVRGRDRICKETIRGIINKYRHIVALSVPRQPWNICLWTPREIWPAEFHSPRFIRVLHSSGYFLNVTKRMIQQTKPAGKI